jgi:hypothetical protein
MEVSQLPQLPVPPADYGYLVALLVALLSLGVVFAAIGLRGYVKYRDRRDAEDRQYRDKREAGDRAFRDEQFKLQQQQWQRESEAREKFRASFDKRNEARFDKLEGDAETFYSKIQEIMDAQQGQIEKLRSDLDRLTMRLESK